LSVQEALHHTSHVESFHRSVIQAVSVTIDVSVIDSNFRSLVETVSATIVVDTIYRTITLPFRKPDHRTNVGTIAGTNHTSYLVHNDRTHQEANTHTVYLLSNDRTYQEANTPAILPFFLSPFDGAINESLSGSIHNPFVQAIQ
jgi:hypothetical protein